MEIICINAETMFIWVDDKLCQFWGKNHKRGTNFRLNGSTALWEWDGVFLRPTNPKFYDDVFDGNGVFVGRWGYVSCRSLSYVSPSTWVFTTTFPSHPFGVGNLETYSVVDLRGSLTNIKASSASHALCIVLEGSSVTIQNTVRMANGVLVAKTSNDTYFISRSTNDAIHMKQTTGSSSS